MLLRVISKQNASVALARKSNSDLKANNHNTVLTDAGDYANRLIDLQRTIGNQAIQRLIAHSNNQDQGKESRTDINRNNQLVNTNPMIGHLLVQIASSRQEKPLAKGSVTTTKKEINVEKRPTSLPQVKPSKLKPVIVKAKEGGTEREGKRGAVGKGKEKKEEEAPSEKHVKD